MPDNLRVQADPHIKRVACQIYTQLPEDKREALQVLQYVRQIIFCLGEDWEAVTRSAPIVPFPQESTGRAGYPRVVPVDPTDPRDKSNRE